jgi:hypothetical protein
MELFLLSPAAPDETLPLSLLAPDAAVLRVRAKHEVPP